MNFQFNNIIFKTALSHKQCNFMRPPQLQITKSGARSLHFLQPMFIPEGWVKMIFPGQLVLEQCEGSQCSRQHELPLEFAGQCQDWEGAGGWRTVEGWRPNAPLPSSSLSPLPPRYHQPMLTLWYCGIAESIIFDILELPAFQMRQHLLAPTPVSQ